MESTNAETSHSSKSYLPLTQYRRNRNSHVTKVTLSPHQASTQNYIGAATEISQKSRWAAVVYLWYGDFGKKKFAIFAPSPVSVLITTPI